MEDIYGKIKSIEDLSEIAKQLKAEGKKIVLCHGVFDLVHPGHIRYLAAAKKEGQVLFVTLTADKYVRKGPGRPIFNEQLRAETLAAIASVDYVAVDYHPTAVEVIRDLKPDVYVKGQEYAQRDKDVTGKISEEEAAVKSVGGKIAFTYDITFSSSKLISDHLDVYPPETRKYLKAIAKKYPIDSIIGQIKKVKKIKALVIGDAIIDQYHYCEPMGKSLKENLVVSKYASEESFAGGVFATANNAAEICGQVDLVTVLGKQNSFETFVRKHLRTNIKAKFFYRDNAPTTVKRRFVATILSQKLFEVCYMNDSPLSLEQEAKIKKHLGRIIANYDVVIVSDFGHGLLGDVLVDFLVKKARFLALNVQTNSANTGFNLVTKYPRANYISVDDPEIRLAAHDKYGDIKDVTRRMRTKLHCDNLMVTRGHLGSINYDNKEGFNETPAFASKIVDRVGAGDAFFAFTAPLIAAGLPKDLVSFIGNAVGALAVQIVCNREAVNVVDLIKYITRLLK